MANFSKNWKENQIRKICAAAPNQLKAIAEKEGQHME